MEFVASPAGRASTASSNVGLKSAGAEFTRQPRWQRSVSRRFAFGAILDDVFEGDDRMIQTKRIYDPPTADDGARILVDRLWPRGASKASLELTSWLREVAPSDALRKWFDHDPARWLKFQQRYAAELEENAAAWKPVLEAASRGKVTLLFGAKDTEHNNAVALRAFLEGQLARR